MVNIPQTIHKMPLSIERRVEPAYCYTLENEEEKPNETLFKDIQTFLEKGKYPPHTTVRQQWAIKSLVASIVHKRGKAIQKKLAVCTFYASTPKKQRE